MKTFTLYRYYYGENHTLGLMFIEGIYACDTLELPWKDNSRDVSCIPEGIYNIFKVPSSDGFRVAVEPVKDRTAIQIHAANHVRELRGCIAVGVKSLNMVMQSRDKLGKLLQLLGSEKGVLDIKGI